MGEKKDRYVPSMRTVKVAAESLPDALHFREDTFQVAADNGRTIRFRKIRFKTKEGSNSRWIYEGKLIVR